MDRPAGLIFDLDQTLIDSRLAAAARRSRRWDLVYSSIPRFSLFDGVADLLELISELRLPTAIVTSSPKPYASRVLAHFEIPSDVLVCYHDTRLHKPNPAPIALALTHLGVAPQTVWSIGDDAKDVLASRAAGTIAGGALWGALDPKALASARPDFVDSTARELHDRLSSYR